MKAYYCDMCQTYFEGSAIGVLYDNSEAGQGKRYDLCTECLEDILKAVKGEATACAGVPDNVPNEEEIPSMSNLYIPVSEEV